ncbi:MAG: fructose-6-phosphate aldolase [Clostridia bacterium]|nr:fructose-6-phosphate aldolase [Clostridia bacterium]
MRLFLDTANVEEIRAAAALGVISGVTTNPTLVAREGRPLAEVLLEICQIIDGPVSAEVLSLEAAAMIAEARELAAIHPNIVIKIPMGAEGLKAVKALSREGIRTNMTLVFSANQALLAALAGATYVSPFVGRLDDIGHDGMEVVGDAVTIFAQYGLETEVIAASIRHPQHVLAAARLGADVATVPYQVLQQMLSHPLTDLGIKRFLRDWEELKNRR